MYSLAYAQFSRIIASPHGAVNCDRMRSRPDQLLSKFGFHGTLVGKAALTGRHLYWQSKGVSLRAGLLRAPLSLGLPGGRPLRALHIPNAKRSW